jgi:hypothetical protein
MRLEEADEDARYGTVGSSAEMTDEDRIVHTVDEESLALRLKPLE